MKTLISSSHRHPQRRAGEHGETSFAGFGHLNTVRFRRILGTVFMRSVFVVLSAVIVLAGCADGPTESSSDDTRRQLARVNITQADLPSGWTSSRSADGMNEPDDETAANSRVVMNEWRACLGIQPNDVAKTQKFVHGAMFTDGGGKHLTHLSTIASVESAMTTRETIARMRSDDGRHCYESAVRTSELRGAQLANWPADSIDVRVTNLDNIDVGDNGVAYRAEVNATYPEGMSLRTFVDVISFTSGNISATMTAGRLSEPPSADVEHAVADAIRSRVVETAL